MNHNTSYSIKMSSAPWSEIHTFQKINNRTTNYHASKHIWQHSSRSKWSIGEQSIKANTFLSLTLTKFTNPIMSLVTIDGSQIGIKFLILFYPQHTFQPRLLETIKFIWQLSLRFYMITKAPPCAHNYLFGYNHWLSQSPSANLLVTLCYVSHFIHFHIIHRPWFRPNKCRCQAILSLDTFNSAGNLSMENELIKMWVSFHDSVPLFLVFFHQNWSLLDCGLSRNYMDKCTL